jgi:uncharacterized protein
MIDALLIAAAIILLLAGIAGSFVPALPGPPLSFAGLLLVHFSGKAHLPFRLLLILGILTVLITLIDLVLPAYATRRAGGSREGMYGAAAGLVVGLFFPPFGIIIGPFLGALLMELALKKPSRQAFRAAIGSLIGLLSGALLKLIFSLVITWHALKALFFPM